jgi:hypothetical protein
MPLSRLTGMRFRKRARAARTCPSCEEVVVAQESVRPLGRLTGIALIPLGQQE